MDVQRPHYQTIVPYPQLQDNYYMATQRTYKFILYPTAAQKRQLAIEFIIPALCGIRRWN
jgi:hypothetical protein